MPELTDFSVRYEWKEGSIPPPYYYEYTIRIGPGSGGEIVFQPDYSFNDPPVWTEKLEFTEQNLIELHALMVEKEVFERDWKQAEEPSVGGSLEWVEVAWRGKQLAIPSQLDSEDAAIMKDVYQAIRSFVPDAVWAKLMSQREEYERAYFERR
jgi:hypothetical protein